jgi:hypothetical protein
MVLDEPGHHRCRVVREAEALADRPRFVSADLVMSEEMDVPVLVP